MKYVVEEGKEVVKLKIEEEMIDTEKANQLKEILGELVDKGNKNIKLDLSKVQATNSSGIGKILFFYKKLVEEGGSLGIEGISEELKETFALLRLDQLFGL